MKKEDAKALIKSVMEKATFRLAPVDKDTVRKGEFIVDSTEKHGYAPGTNPELLRKADDLYIVSTLMGRPANELKLWKEYAPYVSELKKATMDGAAERGAEWIPKELSSELIRMIELELKVAAIFRRINLPTPTFDIPAKRSRSIARLNVGTLNAQTFTTAKVTLSAVTLISYIPVTYELDEDSIIPMLPEIKDDLAQGFAVAQEMAVLDGDTTADHMADDVTDLFDCRVAWNGLRHECLAAAKVDFGAAVASKDLIRKIPLVMGVYGKDPSNLVWIASLDVYHQMKNTTEVVTVDKYGPKATILNGELGKWDGSPIIVSEYLRTDLNASGVNDANYTLNTKSILICVRKDGFIFGDRRKLLIEMDREIKSQQTDIVASARMDFKPRFDTSTQTIVGMGYNIKTGSLT